MDEHYSRPIVDNSEHAAREREARAANSDPLDVTIELTINGISKHRTFSLCDLSHKDWNPIINDMADLIEDSRKGPPPF
jgi:hypothetical protein